jgi:DNA-binding CsgD family transcriptional regulator
VWRSGWRRRRAELEARAAQLHGHAHQLLDGKSGNDTDGHATLDQLEADTALCIERLQTAVLSPNSSHALGRLVAELQQLIVELHDHDLVSRTLRLADCERGLRRLSGCTTTAALLDRVCEEVERSCGLERVLLSRVEAGQWLPWVVNSSVAGEPWVANWSATPIALDELTLETQLLDEHRPELVDDTSGPGIHRMIREGHSHSYVVAPIVPAGRVVGFFHADHLTDGRACDTTDRDVLWRFAEGFGHLYERTALLERMCLQRREIRDRLTALDEALEELTESELALAAQPDTDAPAAAALSFVRSIGTHLDELTAREREVLELIVTGARNADIAQRLAIGEGTVKTHVKHILAKLGAVNRSQVIAQYLGYRDEWRQ